MPKRNALILRTKDDEDLAYLLSVLFKGSVPYIKILFLLCSRKIFTVGEIVVRTRKLNISANITRKIIKEYSKAGICNMITYGGLKNLGKNTLVYVDNPEVKKIIEVIRRGYYEE